MPTTSPTADGVSVFDDTIAHLTYVELQQAIAEGAVALWALGVIEEHGPHLPLATDVYLPNATLRQVRQRLAAAGQPAVIVPPFYWGVNSVTADFVGSIAVRAEIVLELIVDVLCSLHRHGIKHAFLLSGHNDSAHNHTVAKAVQQAREACGIQATFLIDVMMCGILRLDANAPHVLTYPLQYPQGEFLDIHAGEGETSMMWGLSEGLVRAEVAAALPSTKLGFPDLMEWRRGGEHALQKTPDGYFGDPAAADPETGRAMIAGQAQGVAEAILARLRPAEAAA
jgi:creatinine amidohydrolase